MVITKGISLFLAILLCAAGSLTGVEFHTFHREIPATQQIDVQGTMKISYNEGMINSLQNDMVKQTAALDGLSLEGVPMRNTDRKIVNSLIQYSLKADFTDMDDPSLDLSVQYSSDMEGVEKGTLRLILANHAAYTDVQTVRTALNAALSVTATDDTAKIMKNYDAYIAQNKVTHFKLTEYTAEDFKLMTDGFETSLKDNAAVATEISSLIAKALKGYTTRIIKKTESGFRAEISMEQIGPELGNLYITYRKNKGAVARDLYNFAKKMAAAETYTDMPEEFMTYKEFLVKMEEAESEIERLLNILTVGGATEADKAAHQTLKNFKGSKLEYNVSKGDGTYKFTINNDNYYKSALMTKSNIEFTVKTKTDGIIAPKGVIFDLMETLKDPKLGLVN